MDPSVLLALVFVAILVYALYALFYTPAKIVGAILWRGVTGSVAIWIFNLVAGVWGWHLALNPVSALVVGYLGIPGAAALAWLQHAIGTL